MATSFIDGSSQPQPTAATKLYILIIGGSIRGLSLAIDLTQIGHRLTVVERKSPSDKPVLSSGGVLNLTANAIRWLKAIGLGEKLTLISDRVALINVKRYAKGERIKVTETTRSAEDLPPAVVRSAVRQREAYGSRAETGTEGHVFRFQNMELMRKRWADFDPAICTILESIKSCAEWRIASGLPLPSWNGHVGRIILLGDVAHAFSPFAGHGAAMAIEDAACLAMLFAYVREAGDVKAVATVFEFVQRPRTEQIEQIVRINTKMFSLKDGVEQMQQDEF